MTFKWADWLIEPYKKGYGYVVKRRVKSKKGERWKVFGYYSEIEWAITALIKERIRVETGQYVIEAEKVGLARVRTSELIATVNNISSEILGVLNGAS